MKTFFWAATAATTLMLSGCATMLESQPPLTIDQLVERAKKGESVESLLATLRASHARFALTGSDYAKLKERGLPEPVLDELQARELAAVRQDEMMRYPYWRPWGPFYYGPHNWVRPIILPPPKPKI
jgi:hypothetical protein